MGYTKKNQQKPPSYLLEFSFVSLNLFFLKLYSEESYAVTTFFSVMIPLMIYLVLTMFGNLLKFIQMMHIEDTLDENVLLTKKQTKLLLKVLTGLMSYFGIYFLSVQLDTALEPSE